jgi:DNA-binding CsgD family transcriptional regulator
VVLTRSAICVPAETSGGERPRNPWRTTREAQCAAGVICGLTADDIALKLSIKATSVITHRKRAYDRLGVSGHFDLLSLYHATT